MRCPHCETERGIRVLETRTRQDGTKRRKYKCKNQHIFNTVERIEHTPHGGSKLGAAHRIPKDGSDT